MTWGRDAETRGRGDTEAPARWDLPDRGRDESRPGTVKRAPHPYLLLLCALLSSAACSRREDNVNAGPPPSATPSAPGQVVIPPDSPKLQQIRVQAVTTASVATEEVVSPGKIEVNPSRVSRVLLPVAGRISEVMVKLGDAATRGQPLVSLESPDADAAESAYLQAGAALNQARAALAKAQADFDRASDLYEHKAIAKKEVLNSENALAQAKAAVEQAEAVREQTIRRLGILGLKPGDFGQKILVRAPLAGKVLDLSVAPGEYRNDTNAPLMTIADLSTVWVSADVPETYIRLVRPGQRVDIELVAYPGETFHGRVTRIADTVDPQMRTVKVRVEMDNSQGRFRPDMFARIRHTEGVQTVPVVPEGAVIQGNGKSSVFVELGPGRFEPRSVATGKRSGNLLPILSGVKAGERVVVDGAMLLKAY